MAILMIRWDDHDIYTLVPAATPYTCGGRGVAPGDREKGALFLYPAVIPGIVVSMDTLETVKGFLMQPVESFRNQRGTSLGDAIKYFLIIVIINAILTVIVDLIFASAILATLTQAMGQMGMGEVFLMETIGMVVVAIVLVIASLVLLFVFAGWLHLFVYLLGGRKGYAETAKAMIFGSTPYMLIGWIPVIGLFVGGIWSLVLEILGIRELHQVSTGRAAGAVVLSAFILALIIMLIAAWFFISMVSVMPLSYQ